MPTFAAFRRGNTLSNPKNSPSNDLKPAMFLAYLNFAWAGALLVFTIVLSYFVAMDLGMIPGITVHSKIAEKENNKELNKKRQFQLSFAFMLFHIVQILLANMYLRALKITDIHRLTWFVSAYSFAFFMECVAIIYCIFLIHPSMLFIFGCILFCGFKGYTVITANKIRNQYDAEEVNNNQSTLRPAAENMSAQVEATLNDEVGVEPTLNNIV